MDEEAPQSTARYTKIDEAERADAATSTTTSTTSTLKSIASYIIITECCERMAYYGFAGSLVLFFEMKGLSSADAVNQFQLWNGAVYVSPLLGGYMADTYWGAYKTIKIFSIVYLIGLFVFCAATVPLLPDWSLAIVFVAIYIISVGAGGIKPNVSTLGAQQFDVLNNERDKEESKQFFSYFYWAINIGALMSYTLIAYVVQYGVPSLVPVEWGFFAGMVLVTALMFAGVSVFLSGSARYKMQEPNGSMLSVAAKIMHEAWNAEGDTSIANDTKEAANVAKEPLLASESLEQQKRKQREVEEEEDKEDQLDTDEHEGERSSSGGDDGIKDSLWYESRLPASWLDRAYPKYDLAMIEAVKYVLLLVPWLAMMICFWGIYGQTKTAFQLQGCSMDVTISKGLELPVTFMNVFNTLSILVLVPVFETYLYPWLKNAYGYEPTMLDKIGTGLALSGVSMVVAALIEFYRMAHVPSECYYGDSKCEANLSPCLSLDNYQEGDLLPQKSSISIFWQIPQFMLVGLSEILASITSYEFFFSQAPLEMRSVTQAGNMITNALGSWSTIPLVLIVNTGSTPWIPSDINQGHLAYFFFLLSALQAVNYTVFRHMQSSHSEIDQAILSSLSVACRAHSQSI